MQVRFALHALVALVVVPVVAAAPPTMSVHVDAREAPRKLIHSTITIAGLEPGAIDLWYPKYVPGNHSASGPVQNVARLTIHGCGGEALEWDRWSRDQHRITVEVPEGCDTLRIEQTYITTQPSRISRSSDCYSFAEFGGLNWNCLLWYPDGWDLQELVVSPTLQTLPDWRVVSSLGQDVPCIRMAGYHCFDATPLGELVDSPVLMGAIGRGEANIETYDLDTGFGAPHALHLASADPANVEVEEWLIAKIEEMCRQGVYVFGGFPRDEYHFLCLLDDATRFGLEHGESTYIGMRPRTFTSAKQTRLKGGGGSMTVIPHEYVHVWCGKLAAPEGLVREDYHTPIDSEMLWVYEGLTTYYTDVLAVRSGMLSEAEFEHRLVNRMVAAEQRSGRLWRSVEDTARDVANVRTPSKYWGDLRRSAEYYSEGALFWMEADALIRRGTGGRKSLDDFCKRFFDVRVEPVGSQHTYDRDDIVRALRAAHSGEDWDALIRRRLEEPVGSLSMGYLAGLLGRELAYVDEPSELQEDGADGATIDLRTSLGVTLDASSGAVREIVPGSPADLAGLAPGGRVVAVGAGADQYLFSRERIESAVRGSRASGGVTLLIALGDRLTTSDLAYGDGLRWAQLAPVDGGEDLLVEIARPRER